MSNKQYQNYQNESKKITIKKLRIPFFDMLSSYNFCDWINDNYKRCKNETRVCKNEIRVTTNQNIFWQKKNQNNVIRNAYKSTRSN